MSACEPLGPAAYLERAMARLRASLPATATVARHRNGISVEHPDAGADDLARTALEIERVVSSAPYHGASGPLFLPLPCAGVVRGASESSEAATARAWEAVDAAYRVWAGLVWGGSVDTTRLYLYRGAAAIGGDVACEIPIEAVDRVVARVTQKGHHIYLDQVDEGHRLFFSGKPVTGRRFSEARGLFVAGDPGRAPSYVFLCESASFVPWFGKRIRFATDYEGHSEHAYFALARAFVAKAPSGVVLLVTGASLEEEELDALRQMTEEVPSPPFATREVAIARYGLAVVVEGPPSAVEAQSEALRERFAGRSDVRVVHTIAGPDELPGHLVARAYDAARR